LNFLHCRASLNFKKNGQPKLLPHAPISEATPFLKLLSEEAGSPPNLTPPQLQPQPQPQQQHVQTKKGKKSVVVHITPSPLPSPSVSPLPSTSLLHQPSSTVNASDTTLLQMENEDLRHHLEQAQEQIVDLTSANKELQVCENKSRC